MRFSDRIRLAWNIAFNSKARALLAPTWQDNQPVYNETSFENLVRHGWRKNELIFACVSKTAATASFVQLKVKDSRDKDLDDHPLRRLIARPNPFMDEYDFWYSVVVYQKLAGGAYFEKERDRAGRTVRLWPLRPDWLKPVRSQSLFISGYEYAVPGQSPVTMRAEDQTVIGYAIGWGTTISDEPYVPQVTGANWDTILKLEAEWKKRNNYT